MRESSCVCFCSGLILTCILVNTYFIAAVRTEIAVWFSVTIALVGFCHYCYYGSYLAHLEHELEVRQQNQRVIIPSAAEAV